MSFKTRVIKLAIKWTPKILVLWVGNIALKGIATIADFNFDIDARKAYVKTTLLGEAEPIEVWLEDFTVISQEGAYHFILQQAQSNKLWLNNILARIVGKAWKIPETPQLSSYLELVAELFKSGSPRPY